ncbi:MAG: acetate/propionate family kinase [Planctomycetales bacterium]|nr:acetate/propionate family kinase [Planctomycetales bacterium]
MKILVANLGSTSFKYRLFDLPAETQLARGGIDRIGQAQSACFVEVGGRREESSLAVADHAAAVKMCLDQLTHPDFGCLKSVREVAAIGFKAVFAGNLSGVRIVDDELLRKMEDLADIAPAHNPMYARAMRQLRSAFPEIPLVAALETAFHDTIPAANRLYAIPFEWSEQYEVQRWGFHGASHRYLNTRIAQLMSVACSRREQVPASDTVQPNDTALGESGLHSLRVITCHLGGSNSLCAARGGKSLANSLGMSPQSGLPHNNRVGDFDPFALPIILRKSGKSLEQVLEEMSSQGGLLGLSGLSQDVRDLEEAAARGHERAKLALDVFVASIRQYLGAYLTVLGGADAIVFSGGIGENSRFVRAEVCRDMAWAGIVLDESKNDSVPRGSESCISSANSKIQIWVLPTNEEIVVARQTAEVVGTLIHADRH